MQTITSAGTSVNSLPKVFVGPGNFEHGGINLDIGGGRFETATEYLKELGVRNLVWDPYNRTPEQNLRALAEWGECVKQAGLSRTITISNVLNVIKEKPARLKVLEMAAAAVVDRWTPVYIGVYEGDRSGVGRATTRGYQLNRVRKDYLVEVKRYFNYAEVRAGIIVASDSLFC
jgi:hypothetical protein